MLALYIIGGVATYIAVGAKCASVDINDSIDNECSKDYIVKNAMISMWGWPWWMVSEYPRQLICRLVDRKRSARTQRLETEKEVQKLLDSGEI
jgi:hypothetical protein